MWPIKVLVKGGGSGDRECCPGRQEGERVASGMQETEGAYVSSEYGLEAQRLREVLASLERKIRRRAGAKRGQGRRRKIKRRAGAVEAKENKEESGGKAGAGEAKENKEERKVKVEIIRGNQNSMKTIWRLRRCNFK